MTAPRLALAYALDLLLGDPEWFPHPVRWFGSLTRVGERWLRPLGRGPASEMLAGAVLTGSVASIGWALGRSEKCNVAGAACMDGSGDALSSGGSLRRDPRARSGRSRFGPAAARAHCRPRYRASDETEISRAVIETLAESACDGIVAPLFWLAAGGVSCAMSYKAINTLDSMIGHPEPPYRYFGRVAARLDDAVNFIPARLTALGIVAAAKIQGLDAGRARRIWRRDGDKHASPNAGQSEAAMAGALGVRLGGANSYDGHPHYSPLLYAEGGPRQCATPERHCRWSQSCRASRSAPRCLVVARRRRK